MSDDDDDADSTSVHRMPDVVIEDALAAVLDELKSLASTPKTREVRARAETYRRTLDQWAHTTPSDGQRVALRDLVLKLHAQTVELRKVASLAPGPNSNPPSTMSSGPPSGRRR